MATGADDTDLTAAVAAALGIEPPTGVVAERPPIAERDVDDGTNEAIRQRVLLGNDASSDRPFGSIR